MGFRIEAGFVGEHDRTTGEPIPDHISARWQDVESLIDGLIETADILTLLFNLNFYLNVLIILSIK